MEGTWRKRRECRICPQSEKFRSPHLHYQSRAPESRLFPRMHMNEATADGAFTRADHSALWNSRYIRVGNCAQFHQVEACAEEACTKSTHAQKMRVPSRLMRRRAVTQRRLPSVCWTPAADIHLQDGFMCLVMTEDCHHSRIYRLTGRCPSSNGLENAKMYGVLETGSASVLRYVEPILHWMTSNCFSASFSAQFSVLRIFRNFYCFVFLLTPAVEVVSLVFIYSCSFTELTCPLTSQQRWLLPPGHVTVDTRAVSGTLLPSSV
jgi:hypothetical protein